MPTAMALDRFSADFLNSLARQLTRAAHALPFSTSIPRFQCWLYQSRNRLAQLTHHIEKNE